MLNRCTTFFLDFFLPHAVAAATPEIAVTVVSPHSAARVRGLRCRPAAAPPHLTRGVSCWMYEC